MGKPITEAVEGAIKHLIDDFQNKANANRSWNERDLHWSLFHYLKMEDTVKEKYPTQLIRAEFPTAKKYGERKGARGHYDLIVLDRESWLSEAVQAMKPWDSWDEFYRLIKILVAVEIKLWQVRLNDIDRQDMITWDVKKLTDTDNKVVHPYFLNFVQLPFHLPEMGKYYRQLRAGLVKIKEMQPHLRILCIPNDTAIQPDSGENWISPP